MSRLRFPPCCVLVWFVICWFLVCGQESRRLQWLTCSRNQSNCQPAHLSALKPHSSPPRSLPVSNTSPVSHMLKTPKAGNKRWKHSGKMKCLFHRRKDTDAAINCRRVLHSLILLALLALCVPPVQNVFVPTKTSTTELTVLFCSTQSPVMCVCPPCNQYDHCGVSLPRQHLGIISAHTKLSAHAAWDHSPVNKHKPIKGPHCHFGTPPSAPYIWLSGGHVMGECISMTRNQLEM